MLCIKERQSHLGMEQSAMAQLTCDGFHSAYLKGTGVVSGAVNVSEGLTGPALSTCTGSALTISHLVTCLLLSPCFWPQPVAYHTSHYARFKKPSNGYATVLLNCYSQNKTRMRKSQRFLESRGCTDCLLPAPSIEYGALYLPGA